MENLIRKIAWKYARQAFNNELAIDFEELMAEANLAYVEALRTYNPETGKLTTYIWHSVEGELQHYIAKELKYQGKKEYVSDEILYFQEEYHGKFDKLNKEAQEIATIVLSAPNDLFCMAKEDAQMKIVRDLLNKGWDWSKIYLGFKNLKTVFSQ